MIGAKADRRREGPLPLYGKQGSLAAELGARGPGEEAPSLVITPNTCPWVMGGVFSSMPEKHTLPRRYICCDPGALRCIMRAMEAGRVDQPSDEHNSFHDDNQFGQTCL